MRTEEIRRAYLEFFQELDHKIYPSASLVPINDPSLLFTVAGMVQFKDALTGREAPESPRAASCQLCMRAGGKHNDLENVGYTARHHTLFEMLGNFSFGDYFKEDAIAWAWEFIRDTLAFDQEKIWITVHPTDDEAREIWTRKIGIREERVVDHPDNFWEMGDTGPCGPNSEIFYDQGPTIAGGPPGSPNEDGDRFLEFWNLVFPQFDRQPDGELEPLASPGVDTGLGLERTAALMQNVASNYDIDLFRSLMRATATVAGVHNVKDGEQEASLRVIADHIRSSAFLIADDVLPSNEGRGYVLRRVIRRALRHGYKLGVREPFFHRLIEPLAQSMTETYPTLLEGQHRIESVLSQEEDRFATTLRYGMHLLEDALKHLSGNALPGDVAFKLYDTYGFPVDLTQDIARENGLTVDLEEFDRLMSQQRERARSAGQFDVQADGLPRIDSEVTFERDASIGGTSVVQEILRSDQEGTTLVDVLNAGEEGALVLDRTAFYGEAGGQVGDIGHIRSEDCAFEVRDTTRTDRQFLHHGVVVDGPIRKGDFVSNQIDQVRRQDIARNHTATHLLHAALRKTLGTHVRQRGSLVAPDRLRFDFSHDEPLIQSEIESLEDLVNERIAENSQVTTEIVQYDEAVRKGAIALFGEKYDDFVRVLNVGHGFSIELCGGTHVGHSGEIGSLRIVAQSGIAAGVRRIEAVTGRGAHERTRQDDRLIQELADQLNANRNEISKRLKSILEEKKEVEAKLDRATRAAVRDAGRTLVAEAQLVGDVSVVASQVEGDVDSMMRTYDEIRAGLNSCVVALGVVAEGSVHLVCGVSKDLTRSLKAGDLVKYLGSQVGAKGGGRPDMARAGGGENIQALPRALQSVEDWVREQQVETTQ